MLAPEDICDEQRAKELARKKAVFVCLLVLFVSVHGMDPESSGTLTATSIVRDIFQLVFQVVWIWCPTILPQIFLPFPSKAGD